MNPVVRRVALAGLRDLARRVPLALRACQRAMSGWERPRGGSAASRMAEKAARLPQAMSTPETETCSAYATTPPTGWAVGADPVPATLPYAAQRLSWARVRSSCSPTTAIGTAALLRVVATAGLSGGVTGASAVTAARISASARPSAAISRPQATASLNQGPGRKPQAIRSRATERHCQDPPTPERRQREVGVSVARRVVVSRRGRNGGWKS